MWQDRTLNIKTKTVSFEKKTEILHQIPFQP